MGVDKICIIILKVFGILLNVLDAFLEYVNFFLCCYFDSNSVSLIG